MSDIVIKAENLGKKYIIGHQAESGRYVALRDVLMQNARTLWNKTKDLATGKPIIQGDTMEEVWALKDVSFEIRRGEAVGIIGRNGAGKSTLLKILSRITEPSTGRVTIKGRVASLLEVGTGFHPELTGRENIYLNGTILGMTRKEIKHKFDEIVAFAEVEKYLDTPVKRYSSGMYVRLAFAVAAHMEPEILLVDEVLAVGDLAFQKKCLGKMSHVVEEGRTILFVSHNMGAIQMLCKRGLLLDKGVITASGSAEEVVSRYLQGISPGHREWVRGLPTAERAITIERIELLSDIVRTSTDAYIRILLHIWQRIDRAVCGFRVRNNGGVFLFDIRTSFNGIILKGSLGQVIEVTAELTDLRLPPGDYILDVWVSDPYGNDYDYVSGGLLLEVKANPLIASGQYLIPSFGLYYQTSSWHVKYITEQIQ